MVTMAILTAVSYTHLDVYKRQILGTSKGMVDKISLALHLPRITRYISIEEVSSKEEIEDVYKRQWYGWSFLHWKK